MAQLSSYIPSIPFISSFFCYVTRTMITFRNNSPANISIDDTVMMVLSFKYLRMLLFYHNELGLWGVWAIVQKYVVNNIQYFRFRCVEESKIVFVVCNASHFNLTFVIEIFHLFSEATWIQKQKWWHSWNKQLCTSFDVRRKYKFYFR